MERTSSRENVSTKLSRIAELARTAPTLVLTALAHHVDVDFLKEAHRRTRKDGAVGVDGRTAEDFAEDLERNLESLEDGLKSGRYRAPPVRRVHIPKGDGKTRPLGIPTFEDKVLQRGVAMLLEAVYEQDFHDCSYGFRPGVRRTKRWMPSGRERWGCEEGGCWTRTSGRSSTRLTTDGSGRSSTSG